MQTGQKNCVIEIRNVSKKYTLGEKSFLALDQVDLTVGKGEYIAIVGKSGSGKSTLLNLLGGIDSPTEGSILINGEDISAMGEKKLSRFRGENIGFVFQFFQLMPTLTVMENVIMVTHNNELAERCGRTIQIQDGIILRDRVKQTKEGGTA